MKARTIDELTPVTSFDLPGISKQDFLAVLERRDWNFEAVKRDLRIHPKTHPMTMIRRYGVVGEFGNKLRQKGIKNIGKDFGLSLLMSPKEAVGRVRASGAGGDLSDGISFVVDKPQDDEKQSPPVLPADQVASLIAEVNWNLSEFKTKIGINSKSNAIEIFVNSGTTDLLKAKFLEVLQARKYNVCDVALDLNASNMELITLLLISKDELAKTEDYAAISDLSVHDDLDTSIKLISDTFGGFPVNSNFPRHYSHEVLKMLEDCNWNLKALKEQLGVKTYYDTFQHYGILHPLKSKLSLKIKESKGVLTPVANQLGITYPTLNNLVKALDIALETRLTEDKVRKLVKEELESLFEDNVLNLSTRYSYNVRTIIWGIVGSKLKGKFDQELVKKIVDEQIMLFVDERAGIECGFKKVAKIKEGEGERELVLDFSCDNLTQDQIAKISKKIDERTRRQIKEDAVKAIVEKQAFAFLKKLEENYIFRKFSDSEPKKLKVEDVLAVIESAKKTATGVLMPVLDEIASDINNAAQIQEDLWKCGIKSTTNLYLYQLLAVYRIWQSQRFLLADEMGAGKTLVTISAFLKSDEDEALFLGPKASLTRWMDDLGDHTDFDCEVVLLTTEAPTPALLKNKKITIYDPDKKELNDSESRCKYLLNRKPPQNGKKRIIIMNYDVLPKLYEQRTADNLPPIEVGFLALDEEHLLKNPDTKWAKAIYGNGEGDVGIKATNVVAISATPVENDAGDIVPCFQYLAHGRDTAEERLFSDLSRREITGLVAKNADIAGLSMLHGYAAERMIRRRADDVMTGLPKKVVHTVRVNPYDGTMRFENGTVVKLDGNYNEQLSLYEMALRNPKQFEELIVCGAKHDEDAEEPDDYNGSLTQLLRLEQVSTHPGVFVDGCASVKFDAIAWLVRERLKKDKSGLVFHNLQTAAASLTTQLGGQIGRDTIAHIDGKITNRPGDPRRANEVNRFQSKEARVLNATIQTMGTSGNLTQADYMIFVNSPWKPSTRDQGIGRARRIDFLRNYEGREIEIIFLEFDHPISIDALKRKVVTKKSILSDMIVDGNLSPEIIAAFNDCGDSSIVTSVKDATRKPVSMEHLEVSLGQRLHDIIGRITREGSTSELWSEAAIIYTEFLEHKGTYYANKANLDVLSGEHFPDLKGRKLKALDLASATSTMFQAYTEDEDKFRDREFELDVYDFDVDPLMLALGVPRKGRQILGRFKDLGKLEENSFEIVNLSYAFRYAESPAQLIKDVRKILKPNGILTLMLPKNNILPPKFFDTLKLAGFSTRIGPTTKLHSRLDGDSYSRLVEQYGKEVADDISKEAHTEVTYLVVEIDKSKELTADIRDEDLRIQRRIPPISVDKMQKVIGRSVKSLHLPVGGGVEGQIAFGDLSDVIDETRKSQLNSILRKVSNISALAKLHDSNVKATQTKGNNFEGYLRNTLHGIKESVQKMAPLFKDEKEQILQAIRDIQESSETCKDWLSKQGDSVKEIELLLK